MHGFSIFVLNRSRDFVDFFWDLNRNINLKPEVLYVSLIMPGNVAASYKLCSSESSLLQGICNRTRESEQLVVSFADCNPFYSRHLQASSIPIVRVFRIINDNPELILS